MHLILFMYFSGLKPQKLVLKDNALPHIFPSVEEALCHGPRTTERTARVKRRRTALKDITNHANGSALTAAVLTEDVGGKAVVVVPDVAGQVEIESERTDVLCQDEPEGN